VEDNEQLQALALLYASAFLQAHIDGNDGVDYQTIVPLLLIGLSNPSGLVRQAAIKCVAQLQVPAERHLVTVYKFDGIYGVEESKLMDCWQTVRR
jgi:U3 small nucleolar RNA-associated protein 10